MQTQTPPNPEDDNEHLGNAPELQNSGNNVRASWNFSLHDVRVNMAHVDHEAKDILIQCFLWCIDSKHPTSRPEFSRAIGYDNSTVGRIFQGKYVAQDGRRLDVPPKMVTAAKAWLARQKKAFQPVSDFVETPTARRVFLACQLAQESRTPVFLTGRSHIGKSWALEKYAAANNHGRTVYVRMKAACGLGGMVRRINEKIGNSGKCNTAAAIDRIKNGLTPEMLVIFDELHLLMYTYRLASFFACMEVLREIYDETGCGMVLCGTELLLEKMRGGTHGEMEQFIRRGVHKVRLPKMPTREDISAILDHHGIPFPEKKEKINVEVDGKDYVEQPFELLRQLAIRDGLKAITERLRYANKLALKAGDKASIAHFIEADIRITSNQAPDESDWD